MISYLFALSALAGPADEAIDALVEGRTNKALGVLRSASKDDPAMRCLLGEVALQTGRPAEALQVLDDLPADAACAGRAAFLQAEALRALDRPDEAAARYGVLTRSLLKPDVQPLAAQLEEWSAELVADGHPTQAARLLEAASRLEHDAGKRRALARRVAALKPDGSARAFAVEALTEAIEAQDLAEDRRLLAPLMHDPADGRALLASLPSDAATLAVRLSLSPSLAATERIAAQLLMDHPSTPEAAVARLEVGRALAEAGWVVEARRLLEGVEDPEASWALASLAVRVGDPDAEQQVRAVLAAHPTAAFRAEAEATLVNLELDALRRSSSFDAARWDAVADTAPLALEAAWASGDPARLDEVVARWPGQREARVALEQRALTEGLDWLRKSTSRHKDSLLHELQTPEIGIRTVDDGRAAVRVQVRSVEALDLRLHRIDLEGWLRAGGIPSSLGDLDVAIVAPDITWTTEIPAGGVQRELEVPVPVNGPGLYAVTAATTDREARTLMVVGDTKLLARAQGADLLLAAFSNGEPVPKARFLVRSGGNLVEVFADRTGLARARVDPSDEQSVVVVDAPSGPAMLAVGSRFRSAAKPLRTAVDLDRPVYRPGDVVRFRAIARRSGEPLKGSWRISLAQGGLVHQEVRLVAGPEGTVHGEVVLPWSGPSTGPSGSRTEIVELRALPPGEDEPLVLASVPMVSDVRLPYALRFLPDDEQLQVEVRDGQEVPVAGVQVQVGEHTYTTDARGRVASPLPPVGLPVDVPVRILGSSVQRRWTRRPAPSVPMELRLPDSRATPGDAVQVDVSGTGTAVLRVRRQQIVAPRPAPLQRPVSFEPPSLSVFEPLASPEPTGAVVFHTVSERLVDLSTKSVALEGLEEGSYTLQLIRPDGSTDAVSATLDVREGLRLKVAEAPEVGRNVPLQVEDGWALVTAEGGRLLDARLVAPGGRVQLPVDRRWHGAVDLVATGLQDVHTRRLTVDASLRVAVDAERTADRWKVEGRVTDGAGNPQRAQVVVRAIDEELLDEQGAPETLSTNLLAAAVDWRSDAAVSVALAHGGWAVPLAAELMAEVSRTAEKRRAELARDGRFSESRAAGLLGELVVSGSGGAGDLGAFGSGHGGGGRGRGTTGRGAVARSSGSHGLALRGEREVGVWRVVDTDKQGRWSFDVPAPSAQARWRVEAIAVTADSVGRATTTVEPEKVPWLAVDPLAPGWDGDEARPRVRVVNPGAATTVALEVNGKAMSLALAAGEVGEAVVTLTAGASADVVLNGTSTAVSFPLRHPVVVEGPSLPAMLGLDPGPLVFTDSGQAAAAGRAAIAVWPVLNEVERRRATQIVRAAVGGVRSRRPQDPRAVANAVVLVAEAAELLDLPRYVVDETEAWLEVKPSSPRERLELAWARAVAGFAPVEATLGRLDRDRDRLDAEGQALLHRLQGLLGRPRGSIAGTGPQAVLARRADGERAALVETPLPPLGALERADWLRASLASLRTATSVKVAPVALAAEHSTWAARWPAGTAGQRASGRLPTGGPGACGTVQEPCRIARGEFLAVSPSSRLGSSGGLLRLPGEYALGAFVDGRFVLRGDAGDTLYVEVGEAESVFGERALLASAALERSLGGSTRSLLADRPSLEDWSPDLRGQVASLRFADVKADDSGSESWIAAFEDLKDQMPHTPVELPDVLRTADAYHAIGRHDRAIQVYERTIGQVFLEEAEVASLIESIVGTLATIEALQQVVHRYPAVPLVEQATFALPDRLLSLVGALPARAVDRGVTDTEVRLLAAAWDREFVALSPNSVHTPEAGLRLATGLLDLGAEARALAWAERLLARYPDHALVDRWLLLEGLLSTELGDSRGASVALQRLSTDELPLGGGRSGPSPLREDARFALGRIAEVERRWKDAATLYSDVRDAFPEAALSETALTKVALSTVPVVRHPSWQPTSVTVRATNVDEVEVRAYAVDLRTLFLRESGLPRPEDVQIDGLRPSLNVRKSMEAGPFPVERTLSLPLSGPGAWLVRFDADAASSAVWVVRSDLELDAVDSNDTRRLVARYRSAPLQDVQVRAVGSSGIVARETDVRGVALLGVGSRAFAQYGPHYALTLDALPQPIPVVEMRPSALPSNPSLMDRVKSRESERRQKNRSEYDYIGNEAAPVSASSL